MRFAPADVFYGGEEIGRNLPLANQSFGPGTPRRLGDGRLVMIAQQDDLQSGAARANPLEKSRDIAMSEREIHDRQTGAETLHAFTERFLVSHDHHGVELRSEERSNPLHQTGMRRRQKDRR
jgi:hypothetical protein